MAPVTNGVHDLKPGGMGVVAHRMKSHELNGWVRRVAVDTNKQYPNDFLFNGNSYALNIHVPHGTFVLILSKANLKLVGSNVYWECYHVLWGETDLLMLVDKIINPYVNDEELP